MNRLLFLLPVTLLGCDANIFTIQDDIDLGKQVRDEILADTENYNVVAESDAPDAYAHLRRIRDEVLASGEVDHADEFEWEVYLLDDDTLNAFATPGGYMFFYSGLIKYLEQEDHFAGVMGHEMGHAAQRHSSRQLTKQYGISTLLQVAFGDDKGGTAAEIASSLATLQFSRTDEKESDTKSVEYLCKTDWAADGAAGFFAKLEEEGNVEIPAFLSTHPSSSSRIEDIRAHAEELGCSVDLRSDADWAAVQASMP